MAAFTCVIPKCYQDSMKLMRVSSEIKDRPMVEQAFAFMATEMNKKIRAKEFMSDDVINANADDLVLAVKSEDEKAAQEALTAFKDKIAQRQKEEKTSGSNNLVPKTLEKAIAQLNGANVAIISVPGLYAAALAIKALQRKLHVMLFSDNVSVEDELALKELGRKKGLLVMGPDCGTAIISGTPLCFANKVPKGVIGIVGASGTGTQQVCALVAALGQGITHAIGTGGRDLSDAIKGITTVMALDALAVDDETKVIVLLSKPPGAEVEKIIIEKLTQMNKPVVVAFLGSGKSGSENGIYYAANLEEASAKAVALANGKDPVPVTTAFDKKNIIAVTAVISPQQRYIRGLFTGGTLADEAMHTLKPYIGDIYSNIPLNPAFLLESARGSKEHTIIDTGDDEFTRGALHPMIDPSYRNERILQEFSDPETAVILCDVVIGYGSHLDPAKALADAVVAARQKTGRDIAVVTYVCGVEGDPQCLSRQQKTLTDAGIVTAPSGRCAAEIAKGCIT